MNSDAAPSPGHDPKRSRRSRLVGALTIALLAAWVLSMAPLPYSLLAGVAALVALVLLIPLVVESIRERRYSVAVIGVLLGVPATLMIIAGSVLSGVFYGPMSELEECRSTALTEQARIQCESAAQGSMTQWVGGIFGG